MVFPDHTHLLFALISLVINWCLSFKLANSADSFGTTKLSHNVSSESKLVAIKLYIGESMQICL